MRLPLRCLAPIALALILVPPLSWAKTVLKIGSLVADPESYQSQVVRVAGVVTKHKLRHLGGGANGCFQLFTLKDETGSIELTYRSNCAGAKTTLRPRDLVTVEGRFEWGPGKSGQITVQSVLAKVAPSAQ